MMKIMTNVVFLALTVIGLTNIAFAAGETSSKAAASGYDRARWDPIHFKPAITNATNYQCLACHKEILERKPLKASPAGVKSEGSLAWYQTLSTYNGEQETFHRRHMSLEYANQVMDLKCTTCHQGIDPREEVSGSSKTTEKGLTMRKVSDPYVCAMCHAQHDYKRMGMTEPWPQAKKIFQDSCMTCHAAIKTERHQGITFLKADAIEKLGKEDSDVCYGCHGGRAWYKMAFPYHTKQWPGWGDVPAGAASKYSKSGAAPAVVKTAVKPAAPAVAPVAASAGKSGKEAYETICFTCHNVSIAQSPVLGDKAAWAPRIAQGKDALFKTVVSGKGAMPPRGASQLSDDELKAAIDYMISKSQ